MELEDLQFLYSRLQKIVFIQQATIKELTQDDKGIVMVVGFGIPPSVHDDEPTRAVRSAVAMAQLMEEVGLDFSIGITVSQGEKEKTEHLKSLLTCNKLSYFALKRLDTHLSHPLVARSGVSLP